jgi:hypothetical protein
MLRIEFEIGLTQLLYNRLFVYCNGQMYESSAAATCANC